MSFRTTLSFYRPDLPPKMTGADLAGFVSAFAALELSDGPTWTRLGFQVRFGRSVNQDDKPTDWDEPVLEGPEGGGIYITQLIDYDAEARDLPSLVDLAGVLAALESKTIYRADLILGAIARPVLDGLEREPSAEHELGLYLDSWSLRIGPIFTYDLASEGPFHVGWIAVEASGNGYLYPWTFRDLIDRAEALKPIQALMGLCRKTWPVAPVPPRRRAVKARKAMGELWPYPLADQPMDWFWGLVESG